MWFSPLQFTRRSVVFGRSLGSVQKLCNVLYCIDPHCAWLEAVKLSDAPDTHGPPFSPCSELPRWLTRQVHVILQHHSLRRSHRLAQQFLSICELRVASMILIACYPSYVHRNLYMPLRDMSSAVAYTAYSSGPRCGTTLAFTHRFPSI